jgi:HD-GYP domain-containing protein (c-di-GMP phosphodiesterase class II)
LASTAGIIYSHHDCWQGGNPSGLKGNSIPLASRIIHLADRIDVMLDRNIYILEQVKEILRQIGGLSGEVFDPDLTDLFFELSKQESFWFDLTAPWIDDSMLELLPSALISVKRGNLLTVARLFAQVVDDRSSFTYRHSLYVGRICRILAQSARLSNDEAYLLEVAGLLHDLGKLAVPEHIIEKPGRLTANEVDIIKSHSYYTYWLLKPVLPGQKVPAWAAYHHERLDGKGYPFRKPAVELDLAARIVAVADIFTALREDRPYRAGMSTGQIKDILKAQVGGGALDGDVVDMLCSCRKELDDSWSSLSTLNADSIWYGVDNVNSI